MRVLLAGAIERSFQRPVRPSPATRIVLLAVPDSFTARARAAECTPRGAARVLAIVRPVDIGRLGRRRGIAHGGWIPELGQVR